MVASVLSLLPDEAVRGREFTDPAHSVDDLTVLGRMRALLIGRMRSELAGGTWTSAGESNWLVIPDLQALVQARPAFGVGFFGDTRDGVDHRPILDLEQDLLARAGSFGGLLAYYNVRFVSGQWGNLVLFANDSDPAHVRSDPTHLDALTRAADHYRSVRLHRLRLPDGAVGPAPLELESTLLIDFSEMPPWRALRSGRPALPG